MSYSIPFPFENKQSGPTSPSGRVESRRPKIDYRSDEDEMQSPRRVQTDLRATHEGGTSQSMLDQDKVELFGARMLTFLNNGAITLMVSLGHKVGLFEAMATLPPVTSIQLAQATKLHERYVREWLNTMYVGGIVSIDDAVDAKKEHRYYLPPEHAAFLTWGRGPENVAVLSQYISILSSFESKCIECFRSGEGVPPGEFGELKSIMAADSAQTIASSLVDWILPLGPGLVLSDLEEGIDVLDIGCGSGINLITLAKEYPRSWFTGYDANPAHIAVAKNSAEREKLQNIRFKCVSITDSTESSAYDFVTCFGGLVETGDVKNVVKRVYQALRPGGTFLLQDVAASSDPKSNRSHPAGPLLYAISVMFSVPSTIFKTRSDDEAMGVMWGNDKALKIIRETGFKCAGTKQLPDDHCNVFFFCTRD